SSSPRRGRCRRRLPRSCGLPSAADRSPALRSASALRTSWLEAEADLRAELARLARARILLRRDERRRDQHLDAERRLRRRDDETPLESALHLPAPDLRHRRERRLLVLDPERTD